LRGAFCLEGWRGEWGSGREFACSRSEGFQTVPGAHRSLRGGISESAAEAEIYRAKLEQCVALLKKSGAALIWCETTPVPEGEEGRVVGDELKYNAIAREVMERNGIVIDALHGRALKKLPGTGSKPGDVHFSARDTHTWRRRWRR